MMIEPIDCSWLLCTHVFDERLVAAIASCLAQDAGAAEVVVVCNGPASSGIAANVKRAFSQAPSVVVLDTPIQQIIFSLNLGAHHAQGQLLARMDADDLAYPGRLTAQLDYMRRHPDVAVCGTDYDLIDEADGVIRRVRMPRDDEQIRASLFWRNPFCHPTTMIRRSALALVGGYSGGLYAEDYDLWVRLSQVSGLRFVNLPIAGIGYRAEAQGLARRARAAYASVAGTQFRCFANGFGWQWGTAAALTAVKGRLRGARPQAIPDR